MEKVAILIDGGFFTKRYTFLFGRFPTAEDVEFYCSILFHSPEVKETEIYRIFYYDCKPTQKSVKNPLTGKETVQARNDAGKKNFDLQLALEKKEYFALRYGVVKFNNEWRFNLQSYLQKSTTPIKKLVYPQYQQKGVDMRIGLDVAAISLKRLCSAIILVTGDSDFEPVMKFARTEGLRVYWDSMMHQVPPLVPHADLYLTSPYQRSGRQPPTP